MIFVIAAIGGILLLFVSASHWRLAVKSALVLVIFEGVLRKWVLPQASEFLYFLKDALFFGAYIGYFAKEKVRLKIRVPTPLIVLLAAAGCLILLLTVNPTLNSIVVGLLGLKSYLFYAPLCLLLPSLFRSTGELQRFLQYYLLLCIPVCILGTAQFYSPPDSPINVYAASASGTLGGDEREAEVFGEEGNVRVTGTFPFLWGYSTYLTFCLAMAVALLVHNRSWVWLAISAVELLLMTGNMFMTGARAMILATGLIIVGFAVFSYFERNRNKKIIPLLATAILLSSAACAIWFREPVQAFFTRTQDADDSLVGRTLMPLVVEPWLYLDKAGMFGYGPASTQAAGWVLRQQLALPPPMAVPPPSEGESLRIILELGAIGLVLWQALRIYILYRLTLTLYKLRTPLLRHLCLAAVLVHVLFLLTNAPVFNPTAGIYYWFLAGFMFLPALERPTSSRPRLKPKVKGKGPVPVPKLLPIAT